MLPVRIAFDASLPLVATQNFVVGGRKIASGDVVPWRDLGLTEQQMRTWFVAGLVLHLPPEHMGAVSAAAPAAEVSAQPRAERRKERR